ncbi:hypothetical protein [Ensifer aridi]|uniref:hypothetical protein n=1 Tax=Ensifer aridi TaxID=1708715 RepID=UPI000AFA294E|nr:hypothetical protein [Ensifer aridi]
MTEVRFELKGIPDGVRELPRDEQDLVRDMLEKQVCSTDMGDNLMPDRKLLAPRAGVPTRLLEGALGIEGARFGSWTEKSFDAFFEEHLAGGCYLWVQPYKSGPEPVSFAPYSRLRRDWLYVYATEAGMRPCGMTRRDGRLSLLSNLDCDFTFVFGETDLVASFDSAFGGRERICIEFADFLKSTSVDLGEGDIYAFMRTYLPRIGGCDERH